MRSWTLSAMVTSLVVLATPVQAHHSQNAFYKLDETVEITGIVKSFALSNPHPEIVIEVTHANGDTEDMRVYAEGAAGMMRQAGWSDDSLAIGETVTVRGNLARSSDSSMMGRTVTTSAGEVLPMEISDLLGFGFGAEE